MFKNRTKGVELSMNVIIIAALGLLVLILLAIFLMNAFGKTNTATKCDAMGGHCQAGISCTGDYPILSPWTCSANQVCCTKLGGG